ncbi:hypothetical protein EV715DRAFT_200593 [Schizophyllum commune]
MSNPTVYLVSGANRGIGLALVTALAARPDTIVFAGARNPASATELSKLAAAHPGKVHAISLVSADKENSLAAAEVIRKTAGHLDVVIANAAVGDAHEGALDVKREDMIRHFDINVNGPLLLFQATYPLLKESKAPKFVALTSPMGSIHTGASWPGGLYNYGASKAALNWTVRKLHTDFHDIVAFPISPGFVESDMSDEVLEHEPWMASISRVKPEESVNGMLEQVQKATRETHGGRFIDFTGTREWDW